MDKVIDYIVLSEEYAPFLTDKVREKLTEGWQPLGSASCSISEDDNSKYTLFSQAMVKYAPTGCEYIDLLLQEIEDRSETQVVMRNHGAHRLDPNCRLDQGYINCLARVVKDLSTIMGKPLNEDFSPDLLGFIEENSEGNHV